MLHPLDADSLYEDVLYALRAYHSVNGTARDWLETLQLVQLERQKPTGGDSPTDRRRAANGVLLSAIEALHAQDPLGARVLNARFLERQKAQAVANQINTSVDAVNRAQRQAVKRLVEILAARETAARQAAAQNLEAGLPTPTYTELVGLRDTRAQLVSLLLGGQAPWIMALVGIGGLGKTALADALVRQSLRALVFTRVIWLRVETPALSYGAITPEALGRAILGDLTLQLGLQLPDGLTPAQHLTLLRQACKQEPLLVVIDNLEADADTVYLVDQLTMLARPSKFLLTARTRPPGEAAVYVHTLRELSRADAFLLIRQSAAVGGLHELEQAPEADLDDIYAAVGGNPLALKLVVSLAPIQPLPQILDDLQHNQSGKVDEMYRRIYARLWPALSPAAHAVLEAMPLAAAGGATADHLLAITALSSSELWTAIGELVQRSLLEVSGGVRDRRYGIHRLTEQFLRLEIIDWRD